MLRQDERTRLIRAAAAARKHAYAPYSHYAVGAALLTEDGQVITGANVENAVYPLGLCAERVAVFKAVSEGLRGFRGLAVVTENGGTPCGACRQVLWEFAPHLWVVVADAQGRVHWEGPLRNLLPNAFDMDTLAQGQRLG